MDIFPSVPARSSSENTRYQYDQNPYPEIPVDQLLIFKAQSLLLAKCNLITPYYLRNRVIPDLNKCQILDVGCGSGWKTIALAIANPGAQILGIDFSSVSIAMANDRCRAHNLTDRVQFQCLSLEALQEIDRQFDMINCDEILYLIQDPLLCLQLCQGLLKPDGVIRGNFHSLRQRQNFYQMQEFLREIGIFHESSEQSDIDLAHEVFQKLKPNVILKQRLSSPKSNEEVRMNWMLQGDRGFTIPQVFRLLEASNLEYIQMLDWPSWQVLELFDRSQDLQNSANILDFLLMGIAEADLETQLNLYDLLNPVHRLIDFWCGHPVDLTNIPALPEDWTPEQYQKTIVSWHPLLLDESIVKQFEEDLQNLNPFKLSEVLPIVSNQVIIQPHICACLLPLFEGQKTLYSLIDRYFRLYPINPFNNKPNTHIEVLNCLLPSLLALEKFTYILLTTL